MQVEFAPTGLIERDALRALCARRDGPGLRRFAVQVALLLLTGAACLLAPPTWAWLFVLLHGAAQVPFFASMHEAGHGTAFATPWLNRVVCAASAVVQLTNARTFRAFHFAHHRLTHEPTDPELGGVEFMAGWPRGALLVANSTGLPLIVGRVSWVLGSALGVPGTWSKLMPWVPEGDRRAVAWSSRGTLVTWAVFALLATAWAPLWRVAWALIPAHALLAIYVTGEHRGLPQRGHVLQRTRSLIVPRPVRYLLWNMPYHAEHHGWPAVPFFALPALHDAVRDALPHRIALGRLYRRGAHDPAGTGSQA